jgi:hypothetical protein
MTDKPGTRLPGIDKDLSIVFTATEILRELASDPYKAEDGARVYDFSIRWGTLMSGRLKRLEHYYRAGDLAEAQERRYRELRGELEDAMPLIERLGIAWPTVPLESEKVADNLGSLERKKAKKKAGLNEGTGEPGVKKGQF